MEDTAVKTFDGGSIGAPAVALAFSPDGSISCVCSGEFGAMASLDQVEMLTAMSIAFSDMIKLEIEKLRNNLREAA